MQIFWVKLTCPNRASEDRGRARWIQVVLLPIGLIVDSERLTIYEQAGCRRRDYDEAWTGWLRTGWFTSKIQGLTFIKINRGNLDLTERFPLSSLPPQTQTHRRYPPRRWLCEGCVAWDGKGRIHSPHARTCGQERTCHDGRCNAAFAKSTSGVRQRKLDPSLFHLVFVRRAARKVANKRQTRKKMLTLPRHKKLTSRREPLPENRSVRTPPLMRRSIPFRGPLCDSPSSQKILPA